MPALGKLGSSVTLAGCHSSKGKAVGQGILSGYLRANDSTQRVIPFLVPQPASETAPAYRLHPPQPCFPLGGPAELLVTEAAHVRMLRVLHDLFYQPMVDGGFFPVEELQNIFPSLDELIEVHCECRAEHTPPPAPSFAASATRPGA